jgi:hypothetical protein
MYCKIFTGQNVYDGMTDMSIACDNVSVTDGWICLYKNEKFVASFDMVTINGWVLIDSTADTPQTETKGVGYCNECKWFRDKQVCGRCRSKNLFAKADTPQTDYNTNQCVQRVEYVGNDEKSRCWTCKHFERMHETPISSDGSYYTYVVCTAKECNYEPKDEQTDCPWK